MKPDVLLAHGIGGSTDLPIPLASALIGASWALTISFAVLALAWKEPKFDDEPARRGDDRRTSAVLAAVGLFLAGWVLLALFGGPESSDNPSSDNPSSDNPALGAFYVLLWVGLVPLALLFGHIWRSLSPWRTIQRLIFRAIGREETEGFMAWPTWLGYWPAAAGLFAFVWLELATPAAGSVTAVRIWVLVYASAMLLGSLIFGSRWFDRGDPFDVYSAIVARLSPFVDADGRFRLHNPLRTLPQIPIDRGLIAVIAVLLGSTAYDSFSASEFWQSKSAGVEASSLMLVVFIAVVAAAFWTAARAVGGMDQRERRALPGLLAHSLVPIVVGYIFAHYLTYLAEKGQQAVIGLADPLDRGWGLLSGVEPSFWLSQHPATLATIKVGFVLTGHILAVIAAHDRALAILPEPRRMSGQLAMLVLMVCYTFGGLYLLFSV